MLTRDWPIWWWRPHCHSQDTKRFNEALIIRQLVSRIEKMFTLWSNRFLISLTSPSIHPRKQVFKWLFSMSPLPPVHGGKNKDAFPVRTRLFQPEEGISASLHYTPVWWLRGRDISTLSAKMTSTMSSVEDPGLQVRVVKCTGSTTWLLGPLNSFLPLYISSITRSAI